MMDGLKSLFIKPNPQTRLRRCNALVRANARKLDREITNTKQLEIKVKNLILQADKRAAGNSHRQAQARREMRDLAQVLIHHHRTLALLETSKAQLNSVHMQVNEAFALHRIEGSIRTSVGVMHDVNSLISLPELAGTMQELSVELMKAGLIEEMVSENLPQDNIAEFEEAVEGEVDKVLGEILKGRMAATGKLPTALDTQKPDVVNPQQEEEKDEEVNEAVMDQMRYRLEALRS